jgi:hypothetical protein
METGHPYEELYKKILMDGFYVHLFLFPILLSGIYLRRNVPFYK